MNTHFWFAHIFGPIERYRIPSSTCSITYPPFVCLKGPSKYVSHTCTYHVIYHFPIINQLHLYLPELWRSCPHFICFQHKSIMTEQCIRVPNQTRDVFFDVCFAWDLSVLIHWGRVMHICVSKLTWSAPSHYLNQSWNIVNSNLSLFNTMATGAMNEIKMSNHIPLTCLMNIFIEVIKTCNTSSD